MPDRTPNWAKWRHVPELRLWEAVALSLDIDPDAVEINSHGWMADEMLFDESKEFNDRIVIAERNLFHALRPIRQNARSLRLCTLETAHFAAWALSLGTWEVPTELAELAAKPADAKAEASVPADPEMPHPRTKNNYLRVIAALAMGIKDLEMRKPFEAAQLIIDETGLTIDRKTLAGYIKEAYELQNKESE